MSVLADAVWTEVLRYAYALSAGGWPERLGKAGLAALAAGLFVTGWRLRTSPSRRARDGEPGPGVRIDPRAARTAPTPLKRARIAI